MSCPRCPCLFLRPEFLMPRGYRLGLCVPVWVPREPLLFSGSASTSSHLAGISRSYHWKPLERKDLILSDGIPTHSGAKNSHERSNAHSSQELYSLTDPLSTLSSWALQGHLIGWVLPAPFTGEEMRHRSKVMLGDGGSRSGVSASWRGPSHHSYKPCSQTERPQL